MNNLDNHSEGTTKQWVPIFDGFPEMWRVILSNNIIIGYWDFVILKDEYHDKLIQGELVDSEVLLENLKLNYRNEVNNIYIVGVCIDSEFQGKNLSKLILKSMYELFKSLYDQNIIINELVTNAYTEKGQCFFERLGFKYLREHKHHGKIYKIGFKELLEILKDK